MITADQFIKREMERTGKTEFTYAECVEMAERLHQERAAAKAQREVSNEELDRLLFGAPLDEVTR